MSNGIGSTNNSNSVGLPSANVSASNALSLLSFTEANYSTKTLTNGKKFTRVLYNTYQESFTAMIGSKPTVFNTNPWIVRTGNNYTVTFGFNADETILHFNNNKTGIEDKTLRIKGNNICCGNDNTDRIKVIYDESSGTSTLVDTETMQILDTVNIKAAIQALPKRDGHHTNNSIVSVFGTDRLNQPLTFITHSGYAIVWDPATKTTKTIDCFPKEYLNKPKQYLYEDPKIKKAWMVNSQLYVEGEVQELAHTGVIPQGACITALYSSGKSFIYHVDMNNPDKMQIILPQIYNGLSGFSGKRFYWLQDNDIAIFEAGNLIKKVPLTDPSVNLQMVKHFLTDTAATQLTKPLYQIAKDHFNINLREFCTVQDDIFITYDNEMAEFYHIPSKKKLGAIQLDKDDPNLAEICIHPNKVIVRYKEKRNLLYVYAMPQDKEKKLIDRFNFVKLAFLSTLPLIVPPLQLVPLRRNRCSLICAKLRAKVQSILNALKRIFCCRR